MIYYVYVQTYIHTYQGIQTRVEGDGSWDVQDGWSMEISTSARARILWRQATRFATCSACHGIKPYIKLAEEEDKVSSQSFFSRLPFG